MEKKTKSFIWDLIFLVILIAMVIGDIFWVIDGFYSSDTWATGRLFLNAIPGFIIWISWISCLCGVLDDLGKNIPPQIKKSKSIIGFIGCLIVGYYTIIDHWFNVRIWFVLGGFITAIQQGFWALASAISGPLGFFVSELVPLAIGITFLVLVLIMNQKKK